MPSCLDVYILQSFADGQLEGAQRAAVEAHLADCPTCRGLLAQLRAVSDPLRQVPALEPPADLGRRLVAAVRDVEPLPALSCREAQELLSASQDQVLDHVTAQRLEAHLLACAACYRAARRTERLVAALRSVPAEPAPTGLLEQVLTATESLRRERRQPVRWRRWALSGVGLAAAAALMMVVLSQWPRTTETPAARAVAVAPSVPAAVAQPTAKPPSGTVAVAPRPTASPRVRDVQIAGVRPQPRSAGRRLTSRAPTAPGPSTPTPVLPEAPSPELAASTAPPAPTPEPSPLTLASLARPGAVRPVAVAAGEGDKPTEAVPPPSVPASESQPGSVGPASRAPSQPAPVMVAALPAKKAAPKVEPLPPSAAETTRRSWVSRPAAVEHEVALPDHRSERVAMVEAEINNTARRIVRSQPKVWEIH